MTIWRWAGYFSDTPVPHQITLGEGNTPLVHSRRLGPDLGLNQLYFKLETGNPTGSYKDRYAAAAISDMLAHGKSRVIGTSSGNTGSAVAAYCARAGITCEIAILETTPIGKTKQMLAYGAKLYKVRGMGLDAAITAQIIETIQRKAAQPDAKLQISAYTFSSEGMAGVQTISYELAEQAAAFGLTMRHVFSPSGGGGLTLAVARGFAGLADRGELTNPPAVHCVQPEGNNTIAGPLRDGAERAVACVGTTEISGLQVSSVIDGDRVIAACRASGGTGHLVTDQDVWRLQRRMAREEGIFCEPAGAVALAGAVGALQRREIGPDDPIVCLVTGIGFKDPPSFDRMIEGEDCPIIDVDQIDNQ
ncbi:MAG: threonine synthase [Planctomycetaceae bacterium]|nr:threonine synthase [Planctomycetaceae bacterium]